MTFISFLQKPPLSTALIETFAQGYDGKSLRKDLTAGLIVSLVALPLSMALSVAVGLPPQHGLYTAIVAGIVAALFGGSRSQVTGPTAAFVVIVAPIIADFGLRGIVWCQILAGAMLIALGLARLGKVIAYVPYSVTIGFTAGIAVSIAVIALNDLLGVPGVSTGHLPHKVAVLAENIMSFHPATLGVGLFALAVMFFLPRFAPKIPSAIVGIAVATLASIFLQRHGFDIATIGSKFSFIDAQGATQHGIPPMPPRLHVPGLSSDPVYAWPSLAELSAWFMPAVVIALLGGLESLLSATVADSMTGTRHNPNAELNGVGLANVFSGMFLGIPATGAIARTATNINAGSVSPIASVTHAVLLLFFMVSLAPLIAYVPMSALSALLLMTAWRMSHARQFVHLIRRSSKSDAAVALVCFALTVMIDMVAGVVSGVVLAILLFIKRMMDATEVSHHHADSNATEYVLPAGVMLLRFDGPLFFGTANKAFSMRPELLTRDITHVVVDLGDVSMIDATAMNMLEDYLAEIVNGKRTLTVCAAGKISARIRKALDITLLSRIDFVDTPASVLPRR